MALRKASSFLFKNPTSFFANNRSPTAAAEIFALPEKLRGGRIEKFVNYWKAVKDDYYEACKGKFLTVFQVIGNKVQFSISAIRHFLNYINIEEGPLFFSWKSHLLASIYQFILAFNCRNLSCILYTLIFLFIKILCYLIFNSFLETFNNFLEKTSYYQLKYGIQIDLFSLLVQFFCFNHFNSTFTKIIFQTS